MTENAPKVTPNSQSLLNEAALILIPALLEVPPGETSMSISEALFLQQVYYWCTRTCIRDDKGERVLYYTYEQWQNQLPFLSKGWLKKIVRKLETDGWIDVRRGTSFNRYKMGADAKDPQFADMFGQKLLLNGGGAIKVFRTLATRIGVVEAIILQTLHIRTYKKADWWVRKTVVEWHAELLPSVSVRTLERAFSKLEKLGVLVVEKATNQGRSSKRLRVNYVGLANTLSLQIENGPPKLHSLTATSTPTPANSSPGPANSTSTPANTLPLT